MSRCLTISVTLAALISLSACDTGGPANQTNDAGEAAANAAENIAVATNGAIALEGPLAGFIGRHPTDTSGGPAFRADPAVRRAVEATVSDAALRRFILDAPATDAPIISRDGRILAWGCEPHNCGYHNWSISILPDGSAADICVYQGETPDGPSRWYLAGGTREERPGNCPSE